MLKAIYKLDFNLELLTGLHIGGSSDSFDIGGADSTVIKNPLNHEPYVPGSSLKGKIRALLSYRYADVEGNKLVFNNTTIQSIFEPVENNSSEVLVSRAIFRDAVLSSDSKNQLERHLGAGNYTEIKAENSINPLSGKAANPRFIERIPAGVSFDGEIVLHVFDEDDEEALKAGILEGLKMLELNYLGGNGTRGYGRVKVKNTGFVKVEL